MRLFEIIEPTYTRDKRPYSLSQRADHYSRIPDEEIIGVGGSSFVTPHEDDPHMVRKYHKKRIEMQKDGFTWYAVLVTKYHLWDNVHFPRIYVTNDVEHEKLGPIRDWTIEKLLNSGEIRQSEMKHLFARYFSGKYVDKMLSYKDMFSSIQYSHFIALCIRQVIFENTDGFQVKIEDEELARAINTLRELKSEMGNSKFDLEGDNILYRRTAQGLQLVFMDPFF